MFPSTIDIVLCEARDQHHRAASSWPLAVSRCKEFAVCHEQALEQLLQQFSAFAVCFWLDPKVTTALCYRSVRQEQVFTLRNVR